MPGFRTHISVSTGTGVAYAGWGLVQADVPLETALLAGGMCAVAGMLPDVDSDSGVPLRETLAFFATITPLLLLESLMAAGWNPEQIVLASACVYLLVRFGIGEVIRRYTVHRGMWHSLPAAAIAGLVALWFCSCDAVPLRLYKAGAVIAGYLSHLVLDEIYTMRLIGRRGGRRSRKALGSALKIWSRDNWSNGSTYVKLLLLLTWTVSDPVIMRHFGWQDNPVHVAAYGLVREPLEPYFAKSADDQTQPPDDLPPVTRPVAHDLNTPEIDDRFSQLPFNW